MNAQRLPYAAVADLESVVKRIAREGKGRVFVVFDPEKGWFAGDETDVLQQDNVSGAVMVKGRTYADWGRPNIAEALSAIAAARFIGGDEVIKLFRRPPPAARVSKDESAGSSDNSRSAGGQEIKVPR